MTGGTRGGRRRRARGPAAVIALVLAGGGGCGGGSTSVRPEPEEPCGGAATCDTLELRGALAAAALGDGRVAIAAHDGRQRALVVGVAPGPTWAPERLGFTQVAERAGIPLAMVAPDAGPGGSVGAARPAVALAYGASVPPSVRLAWVGLEPAPRIASELVLAEGLPASVAIADDPGPGGRVWVAWVDGAGHAWARRVAAEAGGGSEAAATIAGLDAQPGTSLAVGAEAARAWVARGSAAGLDVVELTGAASGGEGGPAARRIAHASVAAVAMAGSTLAWSDGGGVHTVDLGEDPLRPRTVDDGARSGEPAHVVGAGLAVDRCRDTPVVAYQDQTLGAVVSARVGPRGAVRRQHLDPRWTGGMHLAVACPVVLDLAVRSPPLRQVLRARRAD